MIPSQNHLDVLFKSLRVLDYIRMIPSQNTRIGISTNFTVLDYIRMIPSQNWILPSMAMF